MSLPHRRPRAAGGYRYAFFVPGLTVMAVVGGEVAEDAKNIGTMPAGFMYISEENDEQKVMAMLRAMKAAPRRGKLATL